MVCNLLWWTIGQKKLNFRKNKTRNITKLQQNEIDDEFYKQLEEITRKIYLLKLDKDDVIIDITASDIYDTMKPGEVFDFKLLASPNIADKVDYYSCFAFGDDAIQPLTVKQNDDTLVDVS